MRGLETCSYFKGLVVAFCKHLEGQLIRATVKGVGASVSRRFWRTDRSVVESRVLKLESVKDILID